MTRLVLLCGPSGAGKTTLLQTIVDSYGSQIHLIRRTTTRPRRSGEEDSAEYEFVTLDGFVHDLAIDAFADYTEHDGTLYGVRRGWLEVGLASPSPSILISGVSAALRLKQIHDDAITVAFVYPGSRVELLACGLDITSPPNVELRRRLELRDPGDLVAPGRSRDVEIRMIRTLARVATILSAIRMGTEIHVVPNSAPEMADASECVSSLLWMGQLTGGERK